MRTLALVMGGSALLLAGCGTTKVIEKDRLLTRTVTLDRTVTQVSTSAAPEPTVYVAATEGLNNRLKTVPIKFRLALDRLLPGEYICQVTVLNPSGQKAAFWQAPVMLVP